MPVACIGTRAVEGAETMCELRQRRVLSLDRASGPGEVKRAPADGQRLSVNPPVFVWLPVDGASEHVLQYSRDPAFEDSTTVTVRRDGRRHTRRGHAPFAGVVEFEYTIAPSTMYTLGECLGPGNWYWRHGCEVGEEAEAIFGRARAFTVAEDAVPLPFPDVREVIDHIGSKHPRLIIAPGDVERLRSLGQGVLEQELARVTGSCDRLIGEPLFPEPGFLPEGEEWGPAYTQTFRTFRPFVWGMERCAEAYLLSGEREYGEEARRRLMHLMSWDPDGGSGLGHNDELGTDLVRYGSRAYDYVYDLLSEKEKEDCRRSLAARMEQLYWSLKARPFEVRPFDSHAMDYHLGDLTESCVAMAGEIDVAPWLECCLSLVWAPFYPPFGGPDGGWSEGPNYWQWSTARFLRVFALVRSATGLPVHDREWVRNTGYFKLYCNPPYSQLSPFGDGHEFPAAGGSTMWDLARLTGNPHSMWYAEEQGFRPRSLAAFLSHDDELIARPPTDIPQARCFHDVGLVCMHSDLAHGEDNVHVMMRSSPYGATSHSYADQNAFILHAYGEPLAIASGYYPYYASPHHREWTWQTKAANSIGVNGEGQQTRDWNSRGRITHFETSDYWHYAVGDAREAYAGRLRKFDRHIVYLRPASTHVGPAVVILDDLAAPASSTFQWWLHALEEMAVDSPTQTVRIRRRNAGLEVHFLAPAGLSFSQTDQFTAPPEREYARREAGFADQWHLTAETTEAAQACRFLTVLLPYRVVQEDQPRAVTLLPESSCLGVEVVTEDRRHVVAFRTRPDADPPVSDQGMDPDADVWAASWRGDGTPLGSVSARR
jgi:hypothetical protein